MIPRRIEVEGFLCHRERRVIDLSGSDLWVFSGRNGSGKSTIFDAITFALYGVHRGGEKGLESLIHAGAAEFRVVFEFDLEAERFRIKRGYRRGARGADRLVYRREGGGPGGERWLPVAETGSKEGLASWVRDHVGLNYEMFTSSMLLRQGHAEQLLEVTPKDRFGIVAEVADLRFYQRLHERAEARRKSRKADLDAIRDILSGKPVDEPAAIEEARERSQQAESSRAEAHSDRERLLAIEARSRAWKDLVGRRSQAEREVEEARSILDASETIRAGWRRLQELDRVLPALAEEAERRTEAARLVESLSGRRAERARLASQLDGHERLHGEAGARLAEVIEEIARDEARREAIRDLRAGLAAPIQRAVAASAQFQAIAEIEEDLSGYPEDLEEAADALEAEASRCAEWKAALPTLVRLSRSRAGLVEARSRARAGLEAIAASGGEAHRARAALEAARGARSLARLAREAAESRATRAATLRDSALARLGALQGLGDSSSCDRCGQALTAEHFEAESHRLRDEVGEATREAEEAERSRAEAQDRCEIAEADEEGSRGVADEAVEALAEARRLLSRAEADVARHGRECREAFDSLDESFRLAVSPGPVDDWAATTFPTPVNLDGGARLRDRQPEAARLAAEARRRLEAERADRLRLAEARKALDAIGLRQGDEAAQAERTRLDEEAAALDRCLEGPRQERASAEGDVDRLVALMDGAREEFARLDPLISADLALIEQARSASARARESVPEGWLAAFDGATVEDVGRWDSERSGLRAGGVDRLAAELAQADWKREAAEKQREEIDGQIAEIPAESRRDPDEVARARSRADARLRVAEEAVLERRAELERLVRDRDERAGLESRALEAGRSLAVSTRLAELLDRENLQRDLVRDAERGIIDCANPILREVSGGDLQLRLAGEDEPGANDQALSLEVVDRTHGPGRAIGVAFLSGSQRFRVAVSLALGIGQYARGLDRPIQSVIIDEGFGCLDRQGRDEMIAQLGALKGRLARVVLVSHQEEFADAFADGYRFEVVDGSTVVTEFHR